MCAQVVRVSSVVASVDTIRHDASVDIIDIIATLVSTLNNAGIFFKNNHFSNIMPTYFQ